MATTSDRNTAQRPGLSFVYPAAAGVVIPAGTIVCVQAGNAVPGAATAGLITVGIADASVDNRSGAVGAQLVEAKLGTFMLGNAAADAVTAADVGADCFVLDNDTVARSNGGGSRPKAGRIREVGPGGVWVTFA